MTEVIRYLNEHPFVAAVVSALSLADAFRCVNLGHADWWVPATVAFIAAFLIESKEA